MDPAKPPLPGKGLFGWLGRQVGHVSKAVKTGTPQSKKLYENRTVQEQPHPADPNLKLRRTTIDEVIKESSQKSEDGSQ